MINPQPGATMYEQVAAQLRKQITDGQLRGGQMVPSERTLVQQLGVSRATVIRATRLLRDEGLLEFRRGRGLFVRESNDVVDLRPATGSTAVVRMPTADERREHDLADGGPVLVVTGPDGETSLHSARRLRLRW